MDSTSLLPDDAALLKAMVAAQQGEIERLNFVIAKLCRSQFGRRSERLDESLGQLELSLEELEAVRAERTIAVPPITPGTDAERSALLRPLVEALNRYVLAAAKVHADDTPVPVLAPDEGKPHRAAVGLCAR